MLVPVLAYYLERRDGPRGMADPGFRRLALAAILPLAGVGLLMAVYNFERFGSATDFGFRHLMNGENVWKEELFAPRFFAFNAWVYAFAPAHWIPFFPYVSVARLPPAPDGHLGSEDPFGVIPNIPFALLALVALYLAFRRSTWPLHLRLLCGAIAAEALGTGLATTAFGGAINRYEVDFVPSLIILACIGWLALMDAGRLRGAARLAVAVAAPLLLAFSVTFNVLASLGHNGLFREEHPALYRRIAHRGNALSVKLAQWHGTRFGPVEMKVVFPDDKEGTAEPLLATGVSFLSDYLVVHARTGDSPPELTPTMMGERSTIAGKMKVESAGVSTTLTGIRRACAAAEIATLTSWSFVAAMTRVAPSICASANFSAIWRSSPREASLCSSSRSSGETTVICAPLLRSRSTLRIAMWPPPTTTTGCERSCINSGR